MIKLIKRMTDRKFLQSLDDDLWVSEKKDAFEMTHRECEAAKTELLKTYTNDQINVIMDMSKNKPMSQEEQQEVDIILANIK
jgi:hypothetical protein